MALATKAKVSTGISNEKMDELGMGYYNEEIQNPRRNFSESDTGAQREKLDSIRYDYMPTRIVNEAYARVADFGAKKYAADNWMKGLPQSQLSASLQRHLWAYFEGQNLDTESGLSHLDHVLWNAVALVYAEQNNLCDDRFPNRLEKDKNIKESP